MSLPKEYYDLNIYERYSYYSSLEDKDLTSFLSNIPSEEKKKLYLEGKRLENEEKEREIAELSDKLKANVAKTIKESEETGKPIFPVYR